MLGEILKLSPGRMDDEPFLPRLTRCGFDEVEESLSEPHGGELIAHHKEGSMYIIRWKSVSIDDSAGGEQVRLITMSKIPVDQINRVAELPWQELTVLLDSIHDGIWVIDSDGITLRVNKAMERIAGLRAEEVIGKHVTEPMHKGRLESQEYTGAGGYCSTYSSGGGGFPFSEPGASAPFVRSLSFADKYSIKINSHLVTYLIM